MSLTEHILFNLRVGRGRVAERRALLLRVVSCRPLRCLVEVESFYWILRFFFCSLFCLLLAHTRRGEHAREQEGR